MTSTAGPGSAPVKIWRSPVYLRRCIVTPATVSYSSRAVARTSWDLDRARRQRSDRPPHPDQPHDPLLFWRRPVHPELLGRHRLSASSSSTPASSSLSFCLLSFLFHSFCRSCPSSTVIVVVLHFGCSLCLRLPPDGRAEACSGSAPWLSTRSS